MSTEALHTKAYNKEDLLNLPKTEIHNKTYWYLWLFISVLSTIVGFVLLLMVYNDEMTSAFLGMSILFGILIILPLFMGYFKKKKGYDFKALDAVSGEIQGVRMRRVFMRVLRKLG